MPDLSGIVVFRVAAGNGVDGADVHARYTASACFGSQAAFVLTAVRTMQRRRGW